MTARALFLSIDVEPDNKGWKPFSSTNQALANLNGLPTLFKICSELGVSPTLLCTHSVIASKKLPALFEKAPKGLLWEVGTHFHSGDTPPESLQESSFRDNLERLPEALLDEKFEAIHSLITREFGKPKSYRSGTWVLDKRLLFLLRYYGYTVDTSVTPGISWKLRDRPAYLNAPCRPYWLSEEDPEAEGTSSLLEVPVSIYVPNQGPLKNSLLSSFRTIPAQSGPNFVTQFLRVVRGHTPIWLRPAFTPIRQMVLAAEALEPTGQLHIAMHSSELLPGFSPYARDEIELETVLTRLRQILMHALKRGFKPHILADAPSLFPAKERKDAIVPVITKGIEPPPIAQMDSLQINKTKTLPKRAHR